MEIFNSFYDFFGFELLAESATLVDLFNNLVQIFIGLFIVLFFLRSLIILMLEIGSGKGFIDD